MSDSEQVPVAPDLDTEAEMGMALEEMADDAPDTTGDVLVTLQVRIRGAFTPEAAVEQAIYSFITEGVGKYVFSVTDMNSEENWLIRDMLRLDINNLPDDLKGVVTTKEGP